MSVTFSSAPPPSDVARDRPAAPMWALLLLVTALVYAVMPYVHHMVYGPELIVDAAVRDINARVGYAMSAEARQMLAAQFSMTPTFVSAVASLAGTLLTVLMAGILLNVGSIVLGGDRTPAQALAAASWAAIGVAASRLFLWTLLLTLQGSDTLTGLGWKERATATLGGVVPEPSSAILFYAIETADIVLLVGAIIAAVVLSEQQPRLHPLAAALIALSWPLTVIGGKVMMSVFLGFPVT